MKNSFSFKIDLIQREGSWNHLLFGLKNAEGASICPFRVGWGRCWVFLGVNFFELPLEIFHCFRMGLGCIGIVLALGCGFCGLLGLWICLKRKIAKGIWNLNYFAVFLWFSSYWNVKFGLNLCLNGERRGIFIFLWVEIFKGDLIAGRIRLEVVFLSCGLNSELLLRFGFESWLRNRREAFAVYPCYPVSWNFRGNILTASC